MTTIAKDETPAIPATSATTVGTAGSTFTATADTGECSANATTATTASPAPGDPVACFVSDILQCYRSLSELPALDPCPQVDALFGQLVHLCRQTPADATAARVGVPSLTYLTLY